MCAKKESVLGSSLFSLSHSHSFPGHEGARRHARAGCARPGLRHMASSPPHLSPKLTPHPPAAPRRVSPRRLGNNLPPAAAAPSPPSTPPPPPRHVFLLDLDGVLVDSATELAGSAYACAVARWPDVMVRAGGFTKAEIMAGLAGGRPRVIAGFEALAQARLMAELGPDAGVAAVLEDWPGKTLEAALERWGESPATLAPVFEAHRVRAAADEASWIRANAAYPGIVAALAEVCGPWFVVSSKSAARVSLLMRGLLGQASGFEVGGPRLRAGLQPPDTAKPAAIADLAASVWGGLEEGEGGDGAAAARPTTIHFVDDRYETLAAVAASPVLGNAVQAGRLRLHHASWGYATPEERSAAAADAAVTCLDLETFIELITGGSGE